MAGVIYNEDNRTWTDENGYEYSWVVISMGKDSKPWAFANSFGLTMIGGSTLQCSGSWVPALVAGYGLLARMKGEY